MDARRARAAYAEPLRWLVEPNGPLASKDIRVPFDLMAQDPRTEDPRKQDLKDFAKVLTNTVSNVTAEDCDQQTWAMLSPQQNTLYYALPSLAILAACVSPFVLFAVVGGAGNLRNLLGASLSILQPYRAAPQGLLPTIFQISGTSGGSCAYLEVDWCEDSWITFQMILRSDGFRARELLSD
eukprot:g2089.t1